MKILPKTYVDAEVEGVPVVRYGIRDEKLHSSMRGTCLHGSMLKDNISRPQPWVIKFKRLNQKYQLDAPHSDVSWRFLRAHYYLTFSWFHGGIDLHGFVFISLGS